MKSSGSGRWVDLKPTPHRCRPPVDETHCGPGLLHAIAPLGSVWECECGKLWRVRNDIQFGPAWFKAGWLTRRKYRREQDAAARGHNNPECAEATGEVLEEPPTEIESRYHAGPDDMEIPEPETILHAHEITTNDAALIRAMAGAQFGAASTIVLPSGKAITGAEMQRWADNNP